MSKEYILPIESHIPIHFHGHFRDAFHVAIIDNKEKIQ